MEYTKAWGTIYSGCVTILRREKGKFDTKVPVFISRKQFDLCNEDMTYGKQFNRNAVFSASTRSFFFLNWSVCVCPTCWTRCPFACP